MSLEIGQMVGDYEITGLLGQGGMGSVYRVRNVISQREEALKVLLPDLRHQADLGERFMREIQIHASLDHPNIASLRTALRIDNQLLMVMELVEGKSLDEHLSKGPLSVTAAVQYLRQVLSALGYAHARGVVHRDIKPANIMVTPSGIVKLMDFGIASEAASARLTQTGVAVGSLRYMSPEQVQSAAPDARSDIYSLGITLYEMVTGQLPFQGDSAFSLMHAHMETIPTPPSELVGSLPRTISDAIMKALAKRREDRFQTAEEFSNALTLQESGPTASAPVMMPREQSAATALVDTAILDRLKKDLALYIGPVARILVDRTAKKAGDEKQLYDLLAAEIPSARDREKFLATRRPL